MREQWNINKTTLSLTNGTNKETFIDLGSSCCTTLELFLGFFFLKSCSKISELSLSSPSMNMMLDSMVL